MLLTITGMPCCGKSTAIEVMQSLSIPVVNMGDAVRQKMGQEKVDLKNIREYSTNLRENSGAGFVAHLCIPLIENVMSEGGSVCVDGVRNLEEVAVFKNHNAEFGKVVLIGIHCPQDVRFDRCSKRGRADDYTEFENFLMRDKKELEWGIGSVIAMSDFMIVNDSGKEKLVSY